MSRAPGSYAGLTVMQATLLSMLRKWQAQGHTPSFEEMSVALDTSSKSHVHRLISALEERGYIERIYNAPRSIRVLETPRPVTIGETDGTTDLRRIPSHVLIAELHRRSKNEVAAA